MSSVKLYVYDLSNGLARQMSMQLTGRQIDGIWHTSVVVFGREIFYGQGILMTAPGQSHHGRPLQVIDMGETALDEETLEEYLHEMRQVYTADKYHLLDFNCNSFTNDCIGFLTGGSIPAWIKDLPADFLSTPFGAALRPTIDSMFRRPTPGSDPQPIGTDEQAASDLVQAVASGGYPTPAPTPHPFADANTIAAPIQICTNQPSFKSLLSNHRALVAFFTSKTCPPCRMIEPIFEDIAAEKASRGTAFVKIDLGGFGGSSQVASSYGVRVTPTFIFFFNGEKVHEMKGADAVELKTQVDLLLFQAFPPHPHASKLLPATRAISTDPILYTQVPNLQAVYSKAQSFIKKLPPATLSEQDSSKAILVLSDSVLPFLRNLFEKSGGKVDAEATSIESIRIVCRNWWEVTATLLDALPEAELFPLIDLWRLALLNNVVSSWCAAQSPDYSANPALLILKKVLSLIDSASGSMAHIPKSVLLTTLRMLANTFAHVALARTILNPATCPAILSSNRQSLTTVLISSLLHEDAGVRTAAASVAFNVAAHFQRQRIDAHRSRRPGQGVNAGDDSASEVDADWEVEMVSALVEALRNEASEDVVHRLAASLALFLHLSPFYDAQLRPLLEVLQAKDMLQAKLSGNDTKLSKKDVRRIVQEVVEQLC